MLVLTISTLSLKKGHVRLKTWKSKMAAMAAIMKIYFEILHLNGKVNRLETSSEALG